MLNKIFPIKINHTQDYAEIEFNDCQTQAITVEPTVWENASKEVETMHKALCEVTKAIWFTLYCDYKDHGSFGDIAAIRASHAWSALPEVYRKGMPPLPEPGTNKKDVPHVSVCPDIKL